MSAVGYAVLPITPSLEGLHKQLSDGLLKPAQAAAKKAAGDISKQMADGAKKAAAEVSKARASEQKAAEQVAAAEAKLKQQRDAANRSVAAVQSAELKLAATREKSARDVADAERKVADARESGNLSAITAAESRLAEVRSKSGAAVIDRENALGRARDSVISSADKVARAEREVAQAKDKSAEAAENVIAATKRMDSAQDGAATSTAELTRGLGEADAAAGGFSSKIGDLVKTAGGLAGIAGVGATLVEGFQASGAISTMNDQLGLTGVAAQQLGDEVRAVMTSGVAGSAQDAADAVGTLTSQFSYLGFEGEQTAAELADNFLAMSKTFQIDMAEATQTAGQLVVNGLAPDVETAADLMTASFQRVPAQMRGELPEIINEYGTSFRGLGFSGEEAFGLLVSASEKGKWALDKTGDSLKEFTIRGSDMSKASVGAYEALGLSAEDMAGKITAGGPEARDALQQTAQALLEMEDPATRANTAIALFGTPLEDLSVDQIPQFLEGLTGADAAMAGFQGSSQAVADSISNSLQGRMDALKGTVTSLATDAFMKLWDAGQLVANWARDNGTWLMPLTVGLGTMAGIIGTIVVATKLWTAAKAAHATIMAVATGQQMLFNTALLASPITWIVAGLAAVGVALWAFFTKTETGRQLWDKLTVAFTTGWEWVKSAFAAAWEFIQPILTGLWDTLKVVGAVLFTAVVTPFQIGWNLVSTAISWAWTSVIQPVWEAMKAGLGFLGQAFSWVWNTVIKPVWDALGAGIRWVWDTIVRPAWDGMKIGLDLLGQAFSWAWNNVIKPIWDGLGAGIAWVVDTVVRPVFDRIMQGLDLVKGAFRMAVDVIGSVWDEIKEKTAAPIRFVIDTVYNNGIVAVWNKVAGWLGMDDKTLDPMPMTFASGGVLPGYTPGRDVHKFVNPKTGQGLHLSGGEAIMRPEWTRAVGGAAAVERMNKDARAGHLDQDAHRHARGGVLAFANGGIVQPGAYLTSDVQRSMWDAVRTAFPDAQLSSGTRDYGNGDFHQAGLAIDLGGGWASDLQGIADWIASGYPHATELFWDPGPNIDEGQPTSAIGGHSDHVHWAMREIVDPYTGEVISGGGGGGGRTGVIGGLVRGAMDKIMDPIMDLVPTGPGLIGGLGKGLTDKVYGTFKDWVLSKVPGGGGSSANGDWVGNPGVEQFRPLVEKLLKEKGHPLSLAGSVLRRMNQESGGNPNAINLWDSNAAAGIPSKGLMQTIDPTFQAHMDPGHGDIWDPEDNLRASMNYAVATYGGLAAAYDRAGGYDNGGWLMPGTTLGINESGKPEPVFTNAQWTLIKSLIISTAEVLDPLRVLARNGRDALDHMAQIASGTRRGAQERVDAELGAAGAAVWAALPGEVREALTVAQAVGAQWERVSGYLSEKAVAWSKGEWPIGSARTPVVEPGPGWQQFRLDDSLEQVARANVELAEQVITGKVSPGSDPVANAIYDVFGRDPILPDLARIAALGPNAIAAATDAAMVAFETGETARLEEWTASNSQLTEAVLRARDAAIVTGEMVQGAVNGYLNWAMASDSQGRQGSWQEYFQHYGGEYGTAQGDWLLSQVGLGGILGGKLKDSAANLLIEAAKSPLLAAPAILDDDGRVIGTQLETQQAAAMGTTAAAPGMDPALTADPATLTPAPINPDGAAAKTIEVSVTLPEGKSAFTAEEVRQMLTKIDEDVDEIKIEVNQMKNEPASVTSGVSLMV
ncbi:phage tail tape measure protein [Dietzia maris]